MHEPHLSAEDLVDSVNLFYAGYADGLGLALVLGHLALLLEDGCRHLVQLAFGDGRHLLDGLADLGAELVDEFRQARVLGLQDLVEARLLGKKSRRRTLAPYF